MGTGPLAVRWHEWTLEECRAGAVATAAVELENTGSAAWRAGGDVNVSYHWLDERGNPIVWDGIRTPAPLLDQGGRGRVELPVRAPIPPGGYRLAIDLVAEGRAWFQELGNPPLVIPVEVRTRIRRTLAVAGELDDETRAALDAQDEPVVPLEQAGAVAYLAAGVAPATDWSRRILDAHEEGYAAVGGSVEPVVGALRRKPAALAPWAPGAGRVPGFEHPLLFPSVVKGLDVQLEEIEGLPALRPPPGEPWLYDGRIAVRARPRSGRRPD